MFINRMLRSRKAISPILATLLLIVIAVAAIVVTYAWITTYMGTAQSQAGFIPFRANVAFSTGKITVDIGNSGTSSGQVVKIYVGTSASNTTVQTVSPTLPTTIEPNAVQSFDITYTWSSGTTYYFSVVPSSGAALPFSAPAP
jgi:flagellin-like protein